MAVDPATVSYLLSSIASTAKIIEFGMGLRRRPSEKEVNDIAAAADANASAKFGVSSPAVLAMSKGSWSKPIVEALNERIQETRDRSIQIIKSNMDDHDKEKRLRDVRRSFCATLSQLKNYNGGILPPDAGRMEPSLSRLCALKSTTLVY
jgi:hypothetical protein